MTYVIKIVTNIKNGSTVALKRGGVGGVLPREAPLAPPTTVPMYLPDQRVALLCCDGLQAFRTAMYTYIYI